MSRSKLSVSPGSIVYDLTCKRDEGCFDKYIKTEVNVKVIREGTGCGMISPPLKLEATVPGFAALNFDGTSSSCQVSLDSAKLLKNFDISKAEADFSYVNQPVPKFSLTSDLPGYESVVLEAGKILIIELSYLYKMFS